MTLKSQILADTDIFLNTDEFAEMCSIELEGVTYNIPVVISSDENLAFSKGWDGVYQSNVTVAFRTSDVKRKPVKNQVLVLNGKSYVVVNCSDEMGMLVVKLEVPDT
ncbi:MAG: hypothetical protein H6Q73_2970 [Firmicutes bacterium]|nr:hypothetical protein [Bacillota bacterium]